MSDENADSKIDELTSKACEMSLAIQDLLEKNDPSIFEEYLKFYQVAVDALDLNEARMSDMKRENEYLVDDVSSKLEQLQNLSEDMTQYEAEIERTKQENIKFNAQIEVQKNLNEDLRAKLNKRKLELFLNGVKLSFDLKDGIYKIYSNQQFIGIGIVKDKFLKRDIVIN